MSYIEYLVRHRQFMKLSNLNSDEISQALRIAITEDNPEMVEFLAGITGNENYALYLAIEKGSLKTLKFLAKKIPLIVDDFFQAIDSGNLEIVKFLAPQFEDQLPEALTRVIQNYKLKYENRDLLLLRYLLQLLENEKLDLNLYRLMEYPELIEELLLHPRFFTTYRDNTEFQKYYSRALKSIPEQIRESATEIQPQTLKSLALRRVITESLKTQSKVGIDWNRVNEGRTTSENRYYTIPELEKILLELGIPLPRNARKADLVKLLLTQK